MDVQIFGTNKSNETRKAQRFFKERGIEPQFVDLKKKKTKPSPGELKRFVQKFGLNALVDTEAKAYEESGLAYMRMGDEQLLERIVDEPKMLVQPLVRSGNAMTVGWDEDYWRDWYEAQKSS
ncbi:MAG: arsenate reductase family protein [Trueperaceae bacterium]|nr:arsenate reductase family protein [Trueperaceae bacterium]